MPPSVKGHEIQKAPVHHTYILLVENHFRALVKSQLSVNGLLSLEEFPKGKNVGEIVI